MSYQGQSLYQKNLSLFRLVFLSISCLASIPAWGEASPSPVRPGPDVPSPRSVLGYDIGDEGHLTYYADILKYFNLVDQSSDRVRLAEFGKSTEGRPMVLAIVTSPENHSRLEEYKSIIRKLADPRRLSQEETARLVREGRPVVLIETNIHSTEVSSAETIMALLHKLASSTEPAILDILDKTIALLIASQNPDGHDMQCDWYYKYRGTEYEGLPQTVSPPNYHKYIGHDNNRDFIAFQIVESKNLAELVNEWLPTIHHGMHQMNAHGSREVFLPHATWPYGGQAHPTVPAEWILLGGHVFNEMARQGLTGYYCTGFQGVFYHPSGTAAYSLGHGTNLSMNETAGVWGASSLTIKPEQIEEGARKQTWFNYAPWPGGKWSLKDCVTYEMVVLSGILSCVAKYHIEFLDNFALRLRDQFEKGKKEAPYAFVFPPLSGQNDPVVASNLLNKLIWGLIEVHQANAPFTADGILYPEGSHVILMAQPMRLWAKYLLEVQGQPPLARPFDITAWSQGYMTGVDVKQIDKAFSAELSLVEKVTPPEGSVDAQAEYAYVFSHRMNDASIAINRLLKANHDVYLAAEAFKDGEEWPPGTVVVPAKSSVHEFMKDTAESLHLSVCALNRKIGVKAYKLKQPKIGLYLPVTGGKGNMEEGHMRLILEKHEFDLHQLSDLEVLNGDLREKYDVIIMADGSSKAFHDGPPQPHPLAARGLGKEGVHSLREFVEKGGTFIGNGTGGGLFPLAYFGADMGVKEADRKGLFCPGSILRTAINIAHPLGFGMPAIFPAFFWNSPVYEPTTAQTVASYAVKNVLMSGWITGEDKLVNKAAIVEAPLGQGRLILIGFSVLQRGLAVGTFKILFNAIHYGGAELTSLN
jgi:hypothetical protein